MGLLTSQGSFSLQGQRVGGSGVCKAACPGPSPVVDPRPASGPSTVPVPRLWREEPRCDIGDVSSTCTRPLLREAPALPTRVSA